MASGLLVKHVRCYSQKFQDYSRVHVTNKFIDSMSGSSYSFMYFTGHMFVYFSQIICVDVLIFRHCCLQWWIRAELLCMVYWKYWDCSNATCVLHFLDILFNIRGIWNCYIFLWLKNINWFSLLLNINYFPQG